MLAGVILFVGVFYFILSTITVAVYWANNFEYYNDILLLVISCLIGWILFPCILGIYLGEKTSNINN